MTVVFLVLIPATVQAFDHHHEHHYSSSGDGGCGAPSSASAPPASLPSVSQKRVFVTSTVYTGNLGGRAGADAQCQDRATRAGLTGVFRAWISDGVENAYDRTADVSPWYTTADQEAFPTKLALRGMTQSPLFDEYGGYSARAGNAGAWSGSNSDGVATGQDCQGWLSAAGDTAATTGTALELDATWGGGNAPLGCDAHLPLICVQQ